MFCYQCEQTVRNGCTIAGNCGKDATTAALQDVLVHAAMSLAKVCQKVRSCGIIEHAILREADRELLEALFTTVTNVNFDPIRVEQQIREVVAMREKVRGLIGGHLPDCAGPSRCLGSWQPAPDRAGLLRQAEEVSVTMKIQRDGATVGGLKELILYGLKGMAAYADHAMVLGVEDESVYVFVEHALAALGNPATPADTLLPLAMRVGEVNLRVMEMLDQANTSAYGHPQPTPVRITPVKGRCILVSGHDLKDLDALLQQTQGLGINVYTHGEMLPAHGYPGLKKYPHLAGNYGGAWQDQRQEFEAFPGAILMTTNCIQMPKDTYKARIFTCGLVAWPGITHIHDRNFRPVIEAALAAPGFSGDGADTCITVGFGHHAVLGVADKIIEAVKAGQIRHFFLIGGCDGAKTGRDYYTQFAEAVPEDCVILTLACGKYRFNKLDFGTVAGLPRLLDIGQCNDAYSAIKIAGALAGAFDCGINDLPLSMILSWYEQKAVVILLTLLHLGVKNIRLGPSLPAFLSPEVVELLMGQFGLRPVTNVPMDMNAALARG
ncbi:MAG TPA: hydroxylamine reductase [Kiritimatiellia bacterium]|nr:hydroxylamine reductase [Kiritimatiellia bacterium]HMP00288.1 hydroxylamine reductase [Kiritimatiellia bacterium]